MKPEEREATLTRYRVKEAQRSIRRECAELAFRYPVYSLEDAFEMPQGDRKLLLTYARLHRSEELLELLNVFTASQSKEGYQKLTNDLKSAIKQLTEQL
jgi:hypothetical protein